MGERQVSDEQLELVHGTTKDNLGENLDNALEMVHRLGADLRDERKKTTRLLKALDDLIKLAVSYMEYHGNKFYDEPGRKKLSGLNPAIAKARAETKL